MDAVSAFILFFGGAVLLLAVYFVPYFVASSKEHPQTQAIFVCNLLLGWTFLGWAVALIWACVETESQRARNEAERERPLYERISVTKHDD